MDWSGRKNPTCPSDHVTNKLDDPDPAAHSTSDLVVACQLAVPRVSYWHDAVILDALCQSGSPVDGAPNLCALTNAKGGLTGCQLSRWNLLLELRRKTDSQSVFVTLNCVQQFRETRE